MAERDLYGRDGGKSDIFEPKTTIWRRECSARSDKEFRTYLHGFETVPFSNEIRSWWPRAKRIMYCVFRVIVDVKQVCARIRRDIAVGSVHDIAIEKDGTSGGSYDFDDTVAIRELFQAFLVGDAVFLFRRDFR